MKNLNNSVQILNDASDKLDLIMAKKEKEMVLYEKLLKKRNILIRFVVFWINVFGLFVTGYIAQKGDSVYFYYWAGYCFYYHFLHFRYVKPEMKRKSKEKIEGFNHEIKKLHRVIISEAEEYVISKIHQKFMITIEQFTTKSIGFDLDELAAEIILENEVAKGRMTRLPIKGNPYKSNDEAVRMESVSFQID